MSDSDSGEEQAVDLAALEGEAERTSPQATWARIQSALEELQSIRERKEGARRSRAEIVAGLGDDLSAREPA